MGLKTDIAYTCMHAGKPYSSLLSVEREGKSWAVLMHDCVMQGQRGEGGARNTLRAVGPAVS